MSRFLKFDVYAVLLHAGLVATSCLLPLVAVLALLGRAGCAHAALLLYHLHLHGTQGNAAGLRCCIATRPDSVCISTATLLLYHLLQ